MILDARTDVKTILTLDHAAVRAAEPAESVQPVAAEARGG
jgi:hypothetical protein